MIYVGVECSECGCAVEYEYTQKTRIVRILREKGWSFGKRHLCPDCNKKG